MTYCSDCDGAEVKHASVHCYECGLNLCSPCCVSIHKRKAFRDHGIVTLAEYAAYNDEHIPTGEDHNQDLQNVFVYVDHDRHALAAGNRFYDLNEIKADDLMPVVSFVGPTGVGKSTLMRLFCKEGCAKPFSADPKCQDSTSSDIHAYIGHFETQMNPSTALMLDCEGVGGTLPTSIKETFRYAADKLNHLLSIRKPFVNTTFPRLLYMFSSVFCFVFNGSVREQQTWIGLISTYASQAAAATVNQLTLPVLIVVFNKATVDEGIWDIEEATQKFRNIRLKNLFIIPDRKAAGRRYTSQVQALKEVISTSIDKQKIYSKKAIMQLFSIALPEFSTNPAAVFNFMDVAIRNQPLPQDYPTYLQEFFMCVYNKQRELGVIPQRAFDEAATCLSERLLNSFLHHMVRNNIAIPPGIPDGLRNNVSKVEVALNEYIPCSATHSFPKVPHFVNCENLARDHGEVHQSATTYQEKVPKEGFWPKLLGKTTTITQSCRWEGSIEMDVKYSTAGWLSRLAIPNDVLPNIAENFISEHKKLLKSQKPVLLQLETTRLCLACLLNIPTEFLECKHKLCAHCCTELLENGLIECPFCNKTGPWSHIAIPEGAGYRVLAIDGGGVRGVISAVILHYIEHQLRIPIHQLFDLVMGTSAGGLNAIGFGVLQKTGTEMVDTFKNLGQNAFKKKTMLGIGIFGWCYYGYKYLRKPLHNTLGSIISQTPMLGSSKLPRVAVVACEITQGNPSIVLFTSYNAKNEAYRRELRGTILEAAEATTAAGTYFPVFETNYGTFTDGGIKCNNPCEIGYKEAKRLWPNKTPDLLLSIGTGTWINSNNILKDGLFYFLRLAVKVASDTMEAWVKIEGEDSLKDKCFRLSPDLDQNYAMDDVASIDTLATITEKYIKKNVVQFNLICDNILSKMFYIELPTIVPKETCTLILKTRTRIPQETKMNEPNAFIVNVTIDGTIKPHVITKVKQSNGQIQIEISGMPGKGNIEVHAYCCITYKGEIAPRGYPIGGCPLRIIRDSP